MNPYPNLYDSCIKTKNESTTKNLNFEIKIFVFFVLVFFLKQKRISHQKPRFWDQNTCARAPAPEQSEGRSEGYSFRFVSDFSRSLRPRACSCERGHETKTNRGRSKTHINKRFFSAYSAPLRENWFFYLCFCVCLETFVYFVIRH